MKSENKGDTNLLSQDWAFNDRQRLLRSIGISKPLKNGDIGGVSAREVWMSDVSGDDPRSVKAYLASRGDLRVTWWHFNQQLHNAIFLSSTLEDAMYQFHRRHGAVTLWRLELAKDYHEIVDSVRKGGIAEGIATGVRQLVGALKNGSR